MTQKQAAASPRKDTPVSLPDAMARLSPLGFTYQTAWQQIVAGSIAARRIGKRWFIPAAELDRLEQESADASRPLQSRPVAR